MFVFVIVLLKVEVDWLAVLSPVVLALSAAIHVNEEATLAVKGMLTVAALHIVAELALVIVIAGFTDTVTVCAVPAQLPLVDVGVTV